MADNIQESNGTYSQQVRLLGGTALSDAIANPTATSVGAHILVWDGTQWVRGRGVAVNADPGAVTVLAAHPVLSTGSAHVRQFTASVNTDANAGGGMPSAAGMLWNGASWDRARTPNVFKVVALTAATAETTIWTPAVGKKIRLLGFILTAGAASTLTFKDNTAGTTIFAARAATDTPLAPPSMRNGILSAAANNVLTVTRGTSATLDGVVFGTEE